MISIIIPVLNEIRQIDTCLKSLQYLRSLGHEIVVVDGGSTDNTLEIVKPLADKVISSEKGRGRQMNAGASVAKGDFLLFLHADTRIPENFIDVFNLPEKEECWGCFRVRLSGKQVFFRLIETCMNLRSRFTCIATGDQALFITRSLFTKSGGFKNIDLMEDIELCKRLKKIAKPVYINAAVITSSRRWEKNGIIKTVLQMWCLRFLYYLGYSPARLAKLYY